MRKPPPLREGIRPVFIIGAPRSGTSIMTWAIGQHPNIQTMEETNWIATSAIGGYLSHAIGSSRGLRTHLSNSQYPLGAYLRRLGEFADGVVRDCFDERSRRFYGDSLTSEDLQLAGQHNPELKLLGSPSDPKQRWVDGTPLNTHFTWALAQMFPEAVFIHNLRRPEDVATSLEGFDTMGEASVPLAQGLAIWMQHTEAAALAEQAFGAERVFRLRFERIGDDSEQLFRDLLAFLGEDYCPDCVATVRQRLNSSDVSDRRQANAEDMLEMPEFLRASSLYWQLQNNRPPPPEATSEAAMDQLRDGFEAYCKERSLL
jgi:Sulfotransferase family